MPFELQKIKKTAEQGKAPEQSLFNSKDLQPQPVGPDLIEFYNSSSGQLQNELNLLMNNKDKLNTKKFEQIAIKKNYIPSNKEIDGRLYQLLSFFSEQEKKIYTTGLATDCKFNPGMKKLFNYILSMIKKTAIKQPCVTETGKEYNHLVVQKFLIDYETLEKLGYSTARTNLYYFKEQLDEINFAIYFEMKNKLDSRKNKILKNGSKNKDAELFKTIANTDQGGLEIGPNSVFEWDFYFSKFYFYPQSVYFLEDKIYLIVDYLFNQSRICRKANISRNVPEILDAIGIDYTSESAKKNSKRIIDQILTNGIEQIPPNKDFEVIFEGTKGLFKGFLQGKITLTIKNKKIAEILDQITFNQSKKITALKNRKGKGKKTTPEQPTEAKK